MKRTPEIFEAFSKRPADINRLRDEFAHDAAAASGCVPFSLTDDQKVRLLRSIGLNPFWPDDDKGAA